MAILLIERADLEGECERTGSGRRRSRFGIARIVEPDPVPGELTDA
jgi:hypothetical protein